MTNEKEQYIPNLLKVKITKQMVREEWKKVMPKEDRKQIRTRKQSFMMDRWIEKYPDIDYINFAALEELANRTEYVGKWFREQNAEFNALITLPEWAAKSMSAIEIEKMKDDFKKVNDLNRKTADYKMSLSRHFQDYMERVDNQYSSDLGKLLKNNVKLFIMTYPKNQLPLHYVLSSIQYAAIDKNLSEEEKIELGRDYISPTDYDNNLLNEFRKELWDLSASGGNVAKHLEDLGVDFYIPTKSVESGYLSSIKNLLEYKVSIEKVTGTL